MNNSLDQGLSYKDAGVDIDAGAALVERIKPIAARTRIPGVMAGLGGFGSLFELPLDRYQKPVLVAGTDGVGTKLKLAIETGRHRGVGIDLVAMCVNDIVVQGAEPLFFLDYYATGQLEVAAAAEVISGIGQGCELAGCALVGGETAEMPGMYRQGDYDLAGFCVGIVEKDAIIDGSRVGRGDVLIGLPSTGPHSNGYSLIRAVLKRVNADLDQPMSGRTLLDALMEPTRIYVKSLLSLSQKIAVHAAAHITGGGITENLPRVLSSHVQGVIDLDRWHTPEVFSWLRTQGGIDDMEMLKTFNCGIGMIIVVAREDEQLAMEILTSAGEKPLVIGNLAEGNGKVSYLGAL